MYDKSDTSAPFLTEKKMNLSLDVRGSKVMRCGAIRCDLKGENNAVQHCLTTIRHNTRYAALFASWNDGKVEGTKYILRTYFLKHDEH